MTINSIGTGCAILVRLVIRMMTPVKDQKQSLPDKSDSGYSAPPTQEFKIKVL
jgi:hypothetical protein